MSRLYLLDTTNAVSYENCEFTEALLEGLCDGVKEKIKKTTDVKTRSERVLSYSFLTKILKEIEKDEKKIDIAFDGNGKPFFKNSKTKFSLSHTDGITAVAVSEKNVGVDVELILSERESNIKKVCDRYCADICVDKKTTISEILTYEARNGFCRSNSFEIDLKPFKSDFSRWTELEAALKCEGGGFASIRAIKNEKTGIVCQSVTFEVKKAKYSVSVAEK